MKKLILAFAAIISTFILSSNVAAASVTVDLSKYASETLSETFAAENISYDFASSNYRDTNDVTTIYVFRKDGCKNCENFYNFIKNNLLPAHGDKFRVVSYELSQNNRNFTLLEQIADAYGQKSANGSYATPAVIVGNTMSTGVVDSTRQQEITNLITAGTTDDVTDSSDIKNNMKSIFTDSGITLTTSDKYYPNHALSVLPTDASSLTLTNYEYISAHDISLMNNAVTVPLSNTSLTITIPVTKTYKKYKVAYIENGQISETIDASYQNGSIIFNTSHLSKYAVYGSNTEVLTPSETVETTTPKKSAPTAPNGGVEVTNAISTSVSTFILITSLAGIILTLRQKHSKQC